MKLVGADCNDNGNVNVEGDEVWISEQIVACPVSRNLTVFLRSWLIDREFLLAITRRLRVFRTRSLQEELQLRFEIAERST